MQFDEIASSFLMSYFLLLLLPVASALFAFFVHFLLLRRASSRFVRYDRTTRGVASRLYGGGGAQPAVYVLRVEYRSVFAIAVNTQYVVRTGIAIIIKISSRKVGE